VSKQYQGTKQLRKLLESPNIITIPCCFDGFSAKIVEKAGFAVSFMSGFAVSATRLAMPDTGLISYGDICNGLPQHRMINLLEDGLTPILSTAELEQMGFKLAAYPLTLLASAAASMENALSMLKIGKPPKQMLSFEELKQIVGFHEYGETLKKFERK
jgi:2-methylisocitrate lyase-like PEP mutase family enzyme